MIEFRGVTKRFGTRQVLDGVDFTIGNGEIVFIMGKSGTGKSVLLKNIVGLMRPDEGEIRIDGEAVSHLTESQYLPIRKKCGMVFQYPALLDSLSVFDNIAFGIRAHRIRDLEAGVASLVREKLALVRLPESMLPRFPPELSFGTQKRVSIARTLATGPSTLLFDEPTTGLDPVATRAINQLILDLSRVLKVTSLVVSHDMRCALEIADRILLLDGGRIVAEGTPDAIVASDAPLARAFMRSVGRGKDRTRQGRPDA